MCHGTNNVAKQIMKKNQLHFESIMKISSLSIVNHETKMKTIMKSPPFEDLINQRTGQSISHYLTIHYKNQLYTSKLYNPESRNSNSYVSLKNGNYFSILSFFFIDEKYYMVGNIMKPTCNMTIDFNDENGESTIQVPHIQIVNLIDEIVISEIDEIKSKIIFYRHNNLSYCVTISSQYVL